MQHVHRSLDISAVAEGQEHVAPDKGAASVAEPLLHDAAPPPLVQQPVASPPPILAAWFACGMATLVALGVFAGRPALQGAAVVAGVTVAACVGRPWLLAVSLATAFAAIAISCAYT